MSEEVYFDVIASDGQPVYYLKQYIIDNWDCIEHIKFNKEKILAKGSSIDDIEIFMKDGEEHRLDGPAVLCANGLVEFYIDGELKAIENFYKDPRVKSQFRETRRYKIKKINNRT
jgi:hypothetical protein